MMPVMTTLLSPWLMTVLANYHRRHPKNQRNIVLSRRALSHHVLNKASLVLTLHGWIYHPSPLGMQRGRRSYLTLLWTTGSLNTTTVSHVGYKFIQLKKWWRLYKGWSMRRPPEYVMVG